MIKFCLFWGFLLAMMFALPVPGKEGPCGHPRKPGLGVTPGTLASSADTAHNPSHLSQARTVKLVAISELEK